MLERDIEKALIRRIKTLGGIAYKFVSPGVTGVPDRMCLFPNGKLVFIELKAPRKQPTVRQLREHERIRSLGFTVLVIDNLEDANAFTL